MLTCHAVKKQLYKIDLNAKKKGSKLITGKIIDLIRNYQKGEIINGTTVLTAEKRMYLPKMANLS
jgi:hypothetical protein